MIEKLSKDQNWAKLTPWLGIITLSILLIFFKTSNALFWALFNIPLYMFHQFEEHRWPGGFKNYMNHVINKLPEGEEKLTDKQVFWINILLVWVAFVIFGALTFINLGFGLVIIIFSIINCSTHIFQGIKRREWNPGLVMASLQFVISIYAAYFITTHGLTNIALWWVCAFIFSVAAHGLLFRFMLKN